MKNHSNNKNQTLEEWLWVMILVAGVGDVAAASTIVLIMEQMGLQAYMSWIIAVISFALVGGMYLGWKVGQRYG